MNNIKVSCIVPVYNVEKYLSKCIKSILNQTYKHIELILIDDGSSDASGEICDEWAGNDNRVKVIHQANSGVSVARNVGIFEATGDYICFVDSDDYLEEDYFTLAVEYIEKYRPSILINNIIKDIKKYIPKKKDIVLELDNQKAIEEMFKKQYFDWMAVACFYKTAVCKNINFDKDIKFGEDLLFKYNFIKKSNNDIVYVPLQKYHYVSRVDSACHSYNIIKKVDDLKVLKTIMNLEQNDIGNRVYAREYIPRLVTYYKLAVTSSLKEEQVIGEKIKKEIDRDFWDIQKNSNIRLGVKIKLFRIMVWKKLFKCFQIVGVSVL